MELKDQVTSLETSKKLKELGVKQESLFWWASTFTDHALINHEIGTPISDEEIVSWLITEPDYRANKGLSVSAFTASELAEMLPDALVIDDKMFYLRIAKDIDADDYSETTIKIGKYGEQTYCIDYDTTEANLYPGEFSSESLVEALAACLIHLLENNIITPKS